LAFGFELEVAGFFSNFLGPAEQTTARSEMHADSQARFVRRGTSDQRSDPHGRVDPVEHGDVSV
jgi:hypothetical protein